MTTPDQNWACRMRARLWLYMRPTFVQVRAGFGLVTEALAASVPGSTNRASGRDVTAGGGHPRCGAGKSDGRETERERERREKEDRGHKQAKTFSLFVAVSEGDSLTSGSSRFITLSARTNTHPGFSF